MYICVVHACKHGYMCGHVYKCMLMGKSKVHAGVLSCSLPSMLRQALLLILEMTALASLLAQGVLVSASMRWDYRRVVYHHHLAFKWVWGTEVPSSRLHSQRFIH